MFKLIKMYVKAILNAPGNIEKALEMKQKQYEIINKKYEEIKKNEEK